MFDRLNTLIGVDKLNLIKHSRILVLGCGGVGGYVIEALVRSGIENITIIDKDIVDESNMNRQIIALHSTIGMKKTEAFTSRLTDINPNINLTSMCINITENNMESLNLTSYDYVVDAIDDVKVKVSLIKYAIKNDIKLITSCGTAKKIDASLLSITRLDKTYADPLAKKLRSELRGYDTKKIVALSSSEEALIDGTKLGSCIFVPAVGGLLIANYIIKDIIKIR